LYNLKNKRNYIFELCTTVDGRYFILQDDVFDIKEQRSLGNLWDSIDIFKTIFNNISLENNKEYQNIKENILKLPIFEEKQNLHGLRNILLEWNFFKIRGLVKN
jgi:hypothetical protein